MSRSRRSSSPVGTDRRDFMKTTGAAAAAGALVSTLSIAQSAHAAGSDILKVGLVGAGGRGTGAALQALKADKNVKLTAVGDAFPEELTSSLMNLSKSSPEIAQRIDVPKERQFVGFDAFKKVIDSDIDVVLLATPPHFRPEHMEYAVRAGKHCFVEKPVAVDAQGVHRILAAGEEARKKNLAVVSGLCWRYDFGARAAIEQVNEGAIGDIVSIYAAYKSSGRPKWPMVARNDKMSDMEYQLRNWYYYTWLSGDSIVEQAIHSMDKACWALKDEPPISCTARSRSRTCPGRPGRNEVPPGIGWAGDGGIS